MRENEHGKFEKELQLHGKFLREADDLPGVERWT